MLALAIKNGFQPSFLAVSTIDPRASAVGRTQRTGGIFPSRTGPFHWPPGGSLYVKDAALMAEKAADILLEEKSEALDPLADLPDLEECADDDEM